MQEIESDGSFKMNSLKNFISKKKRIFDNINTLIEEEILKKNPLRYNEINAIRQIKGIQRPQKELDIDVDFEFLDFEKSKLEILKF